MKNDILDQAVTAVQNQEPDPAAVDAAIRRVGDAIASPAASSPVDDTPLVLRGCADIQALVPAFVAGRLSPARALLVEDHTRSCVPCRRALKAVRSGLPVNVPAVAAAVSVRRRPVAALALAASLLLCAALGALWFVRSSAASGPVARVDVVDGLLLAPSAGTRIPAGAEVAGGQAVRTGRSGGAVLVLADGSRVELAERSQVSIARGFGGTTVALARGRVIVQAAKQRGGHLYVKTSDCLVSVTGTVFSVAQGAKGSRVSVLEGEVHVDDGRDEKVLHGGDQTSTNGAVAKVSLEEEFGWSRDRVALLELAGEVARLQKELAAAPAAWSGTDLDPPPRRDARRNGRLRRRPERLGNRRRLLRRPRAAPRVEPRPGLLVGRGPGRAGAAGRGEAPARRPPDVGLLPRRRGGSRHRYEGRRDTPARLSS